MPSNLETVREELELAWIACADGLDCVQRHIEKARAALPAEPDKPAKVWHVGDTGPTGGTIVKVYKPGDPRIALECSASDESNGITWDLAMDMCDGYRLPTRKQMYYIAEAVELADDWYWTREGEGGYACAVRPKQDGWVVFEKTEPQRVRAVRYVGTKAEGRTP